jgi:hypothetical protein
MGFFSDIAIRGYTKSSPDWWNALRTAGMELEGIVGAAVAPTAFTFANNTAVAANVTGLLFSSASYKSAKAWVNVRRTTASNKAFSEVEIWLYYDTVLSSWVLADVVEHGAASGLTFTVTSVGQVQYTSTNMAGASYSGVSQFSAQAVA